jgi:hypothetical protein
MVKIILVIEDPEMVTYYVIPVNLYTDIFFEILIP